ncbi:hypothetical protein [Paenibacillus kribbensis]|uniref:hypothetical protein n=1 Tax=Paenibacillus kribbensis TaxID=172713 RepID=UPI0015B8C988|nr:hypothetical protein [Paenibacillus kribbensis]
MISFNQIFSFLFIWSLYLSHRAEGEGDSLAPLPLQGWVHLGAELMIFGLATPALFRSERYLWAIILAGTFIVNRLLMQWWGQKWLKSSKKADPES